ncbi:MAG: cbb3-type cytochrome oxidase assembly protein CcoS [Deltaproteobacteria bacterium]|nr:cbb3-type cytochrome oxidase assembly protein CcoS [Deltaproteobacteria bacterium]
MIEKTVLYGFLVALTMGLSALAFFVWAVLANQWDDTEDVKYRILEREWEEVRK